MTHAWTDDVARYLLDETICPLSAVTVTVTSERWPIGEKCAGRLWDPR